jgi:hypothetical protein
MKGDKEILPIHSQAVIEGGGSYKGYEYLITFTRHGSRCGYVAIPDGHRGDCADLDCHGGVTFSGTDHNAKDLLPIACNDLWIGFDAAHYMDKHDMVLAKKYFPDLEPEIVRAFSDGIIGEHGRHRTYQYMEDQCHYLIDQLVDSQEK